MRLFTLTDQWFLKRYSYLFVNRSVFILYSGGFDSRVLLELVTKNFKKIDSYSIYAIHINHGVVHYSNYWEKLCIITCNYLKIPIITLRNTVVPNYICSENFCRSLRSIIINVVVPVGGIVVTAHHSGDCVETIIQRLCRGIGILGCASIYYKIYGNSFLLVRPLLYISKGSLYIYAEYSKLIWVEDQSNKNYLCFSRNFLRLCVTNKLKKRWFFFVFTVCRFSLFVCKERFNLLSFVFAAFLFIRDGTKGFNVNKLFSIGNHIRFEVVRFFFYVYYNYVVTRGLLESVERILCRRGQIYIETLGCFVFFLYHDLVLVRTFITYIKRELFILKDVLNTNLYLLSMFSIYRCCYTFLFMGKVMMVSIIDVFNKNKVISIFTHYGIAECDYLKYRIVQYNNVVVGVYGLWFCDVFFCFKYKPVMLFCLY